MAKNDRRRFGDRKDVRLLRSLPAYTKFMPYIMATRNDALKNAGQFFKDLLVFLVSAIPTLVILAVLFFVFRPLLKKLRQKAKARREARAAKKAAKKAQVEKNYM